VNFSSLDEYSAWRLFTSLDGTLRVPSTSGCSSTREYYWFSTCHNPYWIWV